MQLDSKASHPHENVKMEMKTLILGLGNPLLRDDSIGLQVVQLLRSMLEMDPDIELDQDYWGGLRLMERMIGFERAIIIDAIQTGAEPGTIHLLSPGDIPTQRSASAHDVNLPTALEFGRQAGALLPPDGKILLIGVEAEDVLTFDENLSPKVKQALPHAVEAVFAALEREREPI
jgi:hydrogenase maturation protease